jgi:hypothetical protein
MASRVRFGHFNPLFWLCFSHQEQGFRSLSSLFDPSAAGPPTMVSADFSGLIATTLRRR